MVVACVQLFWGVDDNDSPESREFHPTPPRRRHDPSDSDDDDDDIRDAAVINTVIHRPHFRAVNTVDPPLVRAFVCIVLCFASCVLFSHVYPWN